MRRAGAGRSTRAVYTPPPSPRLRDAAVVLPILGLLLLMPPMITLFVDRYDVSGVPLIVAYLFGVWIALIVCAALLARAIARSNRPAGPARDGAEPADGAG